MKRQRWIRALAAALALALLVATTGCITITTPGEQEPPPPPAEPSTPSTTPQQTAPRPDINSFTATPETISRGQSVTLSWNVSNATTVAIQPSVGGVNNSGSVQLSPTRPTTYTLTATNAAGDTRTSLTVTVTAAVTGAPDLVITDVWVSGSIVYYKLHNRGSADAKASESRLWVNEVEEATDYTQPLPAGEERTDSFSNWDWPYASLGGAPEEPLRVETEVCADGENEVAESNEANNCHSLFYGAELGYDFVENAHLAEWRSGAGELDWPMVASDSKGAAFLNHSALEDGRAHADTLATYPQRTSGGSIQGKFGEVYSKYMETRIRELEVPQNAKFTAMVGFKEGATDTDGVTVAFGYIDPSGKTVYLKELDVYYDEVLDILEVPLSSIEGQEVYFLLRVEAGASPDDDWLVWVEPKIVQEQ